MTLYSDDILNVVARWLAPLWDVRCHTHLDSVGTNWHLEVRAMWMSLVFFARQVQTRTASQNWAAVQSISSLNINWLFQRVLWNLRNMRVKKHLLYIRHNATVSEDRAMMEGATPLLAAALQGHTKATLKFRRCLLFYPEAEYGWRCWTWSGMNPCFWDPDTILQIFDDIWLVEYINDHWLLFIHVYSM